MQRRAESPETSADPQTHVAERLIGQLYPEASVGGYSRVNGDVEFYTRINSLVGPDSVVLDFGAGRAWWSDGALPPMTTHLRRLRGRVARVVGVDVDEAVLTNDTLDEAKVITPGAPLPFPDETFDVVMADWVLEHVDSDSVAAVTSEIMRVLRPGGWFAARTPNKWGIIGLGARAVPNSLHTRVLRVLQPSRQEVDVFPVRYQLNTRRDLRRAFAPHRVVVYTHTSEPTYFGSSPMAWRLGRLVGRATPTRLEPTLLVFVQRGTVHDR